MWALERKGVLGMTEDQVNGSAAGSDQGFGSLVSPDDAAAPGAGLSPTTGCPRTSESHDVRRGTSRGMSLVRARHLAPINGRDQLRVVAFVLVCIAMGKPHHRSGERVAGADVGVDGHRVA
jgi:hypothetical protein